MGLNKVRVGVRSQDWSQTIWRFMFTLQFNRKDILCCYWGSRVWHILEFLSLKLGLRTAGNLQVLEVCMSRGDN